jgi:hypothetical protein
VPGRAAVDGLAGTMPGPEGIGKTDCEETGPHWDEGSDEETIAEMGGSVRGCESVDSRDAVGGRLLLELGRTSEFGSRVAAGQEEGDWRSETPSSTNDSPEARKDWPGCGWCADVEEEGVAADGAVEGAGEEGDATEGARKDWPGSRKEWLVT